MRIRKTIKIHVGKPDRIREFTQNVNHQWALLKTLEHIKF